MVASYSDARPHYCGGSANRVTRLLVFQMKNAILLTVLFSWLVVGYSLKIGALETDAFAEDELTFWKGFDIELLRKVSSSSFEYSDIVAYTSLTQLLSDVETNVVDIGLGAITKTAEREETIDFTHTTFDSGLRIMTRNDVDTSSVMSKFFRSFFNSQFLFTIFILILVVLLISVVVWTLEVYFTKPEMKFFNDDWKVGIVEALGWSTKNLMKKETYAPNHPVSKALGFLLLIGSIVFLASLTAYIAAQMIVLSDNSPTISNLDDLIGKRVGTVDGSTSYDYLLENAGGSIIRTYASLEEMFTTFHDEQRLDAVFYDFPILLYHVNTRERQGVFDTVVVGPVYDRQSYGFAVAPALPTLREDLNRELLDYIFSPDYFELYGRYFSSAGGEQQDVHLNVGWFVWLIIAILILLTIGIVYFIIHKIKNTSEEDDLYKEIDEELEKVDARMVSREDIFRMLSRVMQLNLLILRQGHFDALRERRYSPESIDNDEFDSILKKFIDGTVQHIKENQNTKTKSKQV